MTKITLIKCDQCDQTWKSTERKTMYVGHITFYNKEVAKQLEGNIEVDWCSEQCRLDWLEAHARS